MATRTYSVQEIKNNAKIIKETSARLGVIVKYSHALEISSVIAGYKDWNTACAMAEKTQTDTFDLQVEIQKLKQMWEVAKEEQEQYVEREENENSALFLAARFGRLDIVDEVLKAVNIDELQNVPFDSYEIALIYGHVEIADRLLKAGLVPRRDVQNTLIGFVESTKTIEFFYKNKMMVDTDDAAKAVLDSIEEGFYDVAERIVDLLAPNIQILRHELIFNMQDWVNGATSDDDEKVDFVRKLLPKIK